MFVGRVMEVWPSRRDLVETYERRLSSSQLRQFLLRRWSGVLSPDEIRALRTSRDADAILHRYEHMQRVRFAVVEAFSGPPIAQVFTHSGSCGVDFQEGQTYLVNATQDSGWYRVRACSRTDRVESFEAAEDLKALRAWKSGSPLAPRVYGQIAAAELRTDTRLRLFGDGGERLVPIDSSGRFSAEGLERKEYRLQIDDARGKADYAVDLGPVSCFEARASFDGRWRIWTSGPIMMRSPPAPELPAPPELIPLPITLPSAPL